VAQVARRYALKGRSLIKGCVDVYNPRMTFSRQSSPLSMLDAFSVSVLYHLSAPGFRKANCN
jgi:hypothetical protein